MGMDGMCVGRESERAKERVRESTRNKGRREMNQEELKTNPVAFVFFRVPFFLRRRPRRQARTGVSALLPFGSTSAVPPTRRPAPPQKPRLLALVYPIASIVPPNPPKTFALFPCFRPPSSSLSLSPGSSDPSVARLGSPQLTPKYPLLFVFWSPPFFCLSPGPDNHIVSPGPDNHIAPLTKIQKGYMYTHPHVIRPHLFIITAREGQTHQCPTPCVVLLLPPTPRRQMTGRAEGGRTRCSRAPTVRVP